MNGKNVTKQEMIEILKIIILNSNAVKKIYII